MGGNTKQHPGLRDTAGVFIPTLGRPSEGVVAFSERPIVVPTNFLTRIDALFRVLLLRRLRFPLLSLYAFLPMWPSIRFLSTTCRLLESRVVGRLASVWTCTINWWWTTLVSPIRVMALPDLVPQR